MLHAAEADEATRVSDEDVEAALVDLLEHSAPVLRSSLGANPDLAELADVDASPEAAAPTTGGWFAYGAAARAAPLDHHE